MNRKRYELSFDPLADTDFIALVEDFRTQGYAVMDVFRMALRLLAGETSEARTDDLESSPLIAELRNQIATMQTEIDGLNALLAERLAGIEMELSRLQSKGEWIEDRSALADPNDARQSALSAKLKAMQFGKLQ